MDAHHPTERLTPLLVVYSLIPLTQLVKATLPITKEEIPMKVTVVKENGVDLMILLHTAGKVKYRGNILAIPVLLISLQAGGEEWFCPPG